MEDALNGSEKTKARQSYCREEDVENREKKMSLEDILELQEV